MSTALANVRVFGGQNLTESTAIYIKNGILVDHVEGAVEVDGQGGVILPGLFDAHVDRSPHRPPPTTGQK